ncbi:hypothetical protein HJC23_003789 [Cyclotella cryptica]|uniref:Nuclear speckle splicing regulatory protein 1 N-terminal domain-containing protein n=1 Tax=Cyclotella cryptica TaxID=29204 RepID=A0ABD3QU32_9STRA|eukprot:CCRYP_002224-RA/>CCRYP_002224-RA protein AED:0.16 eAED:0.15 QI:0/-1/0/1/-1/1/1/0/318
MNIDHLSYGLNSRTNADAATTKAAAPPPRKKKGLAGFDSDSSSDDENRNASTGRSATNKAIAAEQHALRKRAEAALSTEYDYDGEYESFTKNKPEKKKVVQEKSSKYISDLMQSAQRRTQEQEIIYERKIAKDQALEDAEMQYDGKEKFITSAYKRKLEEREAWILAEKEREKKEKEDDVTKKTAGSFLFAGFGRNVLTGGVEKDGKDDKFDSHRRDSKDNKSEDSDYRRSDASRETERVGHISRRRGSRDADSCHSAKPQNSNGESGSSQAAFIGMNNDQTESVPPKTRRQILEERATKIREARERYFQRKGLQPTQ